MRKVIQLFIMFVLSVQLFHCQNFIKDWGEVVQFENDGQIKSAYEKSLEIFKLSKNKSDKDYLRAFLHISKYYVKLQENSIQEFVTLFKTEYNSNETNNFCKAFLSHYFAISLSKYYDENKYKLNYSGTIEDHDVLKWNKVKFEYEIQTFFERSISFKDLDLLKANDFNRIIDLADLEVYPNDFSILDFFKESYAKVLKKQVYINGDIVHVPFKEFLTKDFNNIQDHKVQKVLSIYKELENKYISKPNMLTYNRLNLSSLNEEKLLLQYIALIENRFVKDLLELDLLSTYLLALEKNKDQNLLDKALVLNEDIIKNSINPNVVIRAKEIKANLYAKNLSLTLLNKYVAHKKFRININYKNVEKIDFKYIKITYKEFKSIKKDSLSNYIFTRKPVVEFSKLLPSKKYLNYNHEVLMPDFKENGYYIVLASTMKNNNEEEKIHEFAKVEVNDLNVLEYFSNHQDNIYLLSKISGLPLKGIKVLEEQRSYISDKNGKVSFELLKKKDNDFNKVIAQIIYKNDTIDFFKVRVNKESVVKIAKNDKDYDIENYLFTDRKIYRPGQKIFFKAILFLKSESSNEISKRKPLKNLYVKVILEDHKGEEVEVKHIKTNEFGSVFSHFQLPKNCSTGEYEISINEPDDEFLEKDKYWSKKEEFHEIWDEYSLEIDKTVEISVEEYKRPTFEAEFNKINAHYKLGDKVVLTGQVTGLAGNKIVGASIVPKVKVNNEEILLPQTYTDGNGSFKFEYQTIKNDYEFDTRYNFIVKITDINGETKEINQQIVFNKKEFYITLLNHNSVNFIDDLKPINIVLKDYNQVEVKSKGYIKILFDDTNELKTSLLDFDSTEINDEERVKLFPYQKFIKNDEEIFNNEYNTVLDSIPFDTSISNFYLNDYFKNKPLGKYSIKISTQDSQGNVIENNFNYLLSSKTGQVNKTELFSVFNEKVGDKVKIRIYSFIKDLKVNCFLFSDSNQVENIKLIELHNGYAEFESKFYDNDFAAYFFSYYDEFFNKKIVQLQKRNEVDINDLKFQVLTYRNKIQPGSHEKWSFKIENSNTISEVLANMYDTSLDQFKNHQWEFFEKLRFSQKQFEFPHHFAYNSDYDNSNELFFKDFDYEIIYQNKVFKTQNELQWFGFSHNFMFINDIIKQYETYKNDNISSNYGSTEIFGKVVDQKGAALPGTTVKIYNTDIQVSTGFDGTFRIKAEIGDMLEVSFVGMSTEKSKITKREMNFVLKSRSNLEQVVVVGYGVSRKKSSVSYLTASISSVTIQQDSILVKNFQTFTQLLQGKVSGVQITMSSGTSGSSKNAVVIRGVNSLNANHEPLIIIDGVPVKREEYLKINPDDIIGFEILKSNNNLTTLYGLQAMNGVILISTKNTKVTFEEVKVRKNFDETAFFNPDIKTNSKGEFLLEFDTPESLTKWRLMMLAHNKKGQSANYESTIVAQKELMVIPNFPRFFREKDEAKIKIKISNLSHEAKNGKIKLQLFNSSNGEELIGLIKKSVFNFSSDAKGSTVATFEFKVPENIEGLQYKVLAIADKFSDGEESVIPVLTNKVFITESKPLWIKPNQSQSIEFLNLKENSETKTDVAYKLSLTTNPVWEALESLPYLVEYEHDCSEQLFSKYFANQLVFQILKDNPNIQSYLNQLNETQFKDIILDETTKTALKEEQPWRFEKSNAIYQTLKMLSSTNSVQANNSILNKIKQNQSPNGGFGWFGSEYENPFISLHIAKNVAQLKLITKLESDDLNQIEHELIKFIDQKFLEIIDISKVNIDLGMDYVFVRSLSVEDYPLNQKLVDLLNKFIENQKKSWLSLTLQSKAKFAIILFQLGDKDFALKIMNSIRQTAVLDQSKGMFWKVEGGYNWYGSSVETHVVLMQAFATIDYKENEMEEMKIWLIHQRKNQKWETTKTSTQAIFALLNYGKKWSEAKSEFITSSDLINSLIKTNVVNGQKGKIAIEVNQNEIKKIDAKIEFKNTSDIPVYGSAFYQYFESIDKVKNIATDEMYIEKRILPTSGVNINELKVGDEVKVQLSFVVKNDLDFIHIKDLRSSCFEPKDIISEYKSIHGVNYYQSNKDIATHFFFDKLPKGSYTIEYVLKLNNAGNYQDGFVTIQSMYAPEYKAQTSSGKISVQE